MQRRIELLTLSIVLGLGIGGCDLLRAMTQSLQPQPTQSVTPLPPEPSTPVETDAPAPPPPKPSGRAAVLAGLPAGRQVNIRSQPSEQASVTYYGTIGDRIHVTQQRQDGNGTTWYYVTFDDGNARGWVYGTLVRFLEPSTPANPSPNPNTPINSDTALRRCRSQAETELPNSRIQVSLGWLNSDGSFVVKWSASNGAAGTCTVDRNGWVVSFVNDYDGNNPPDNTAPPAALRGCENRVARELGQSLYDIEVRSSTAYADGTFGVDWWTTDGRSGFCRVSRNGNVYSFVINDRPSPSQVALRRCRDRAKQAYPRSRIDVYIDPRERGRNYKVIWTADTGEDGFCRVDQSGRLYEFVDNSSGGGDGDVRCVGNIFDDTTFTAYARNREFRRVEFRNTQTGLRSTAYLSAAGENQEGHRIYRGRVSDSGAAEVTVVDRSGGNPSPGTEVAVAYNREWARGRCR